MKMTIQFLTLFLMINIICFGQISKKVNYKNTNFNTYSIRVDKSNLELFFLFENTYKSPHSEFVQVFEEFFDSLEIGKSLFITNSSIVNSDCSPLGLYISEYQSYRSVNSSNGSGNFYLKPNGGILISEKDAVICKTDDINNYLGSNTRIALQSGPMLIHDNQINSKFGVNSQNKHIRSGVGIYTKSSNEKFLVFAISLDPVNFYDFSLLFKNEFGCDNALCIESEGSLMNIPNLDNPNDYSDNVVCNYLVYKPIPMEGSGTGFALSSEGYIATNYHVIDGATTISLKGLNGDFNRTYDLKIIEIDIDNDLAILKIDDPSFTSLGNIPYTLNPSIIDVGSGVFATGYPLRSTMGDEIKLTNGMISAKSGFMGDMNCYQISVPIQPGNSGGPLFNEKGEVVGITNAVHTGAQNANYAIKTNLLYGLMGMMNQTPKLPAYNTISNLPLNEQFKKIKNFVYIIEASR